MARSQFLDLLDGYEIPKGEGNKPNLGKRFFVRDISGVMSPEKKRRASSRFYKLAYTLSRMFTYTKARVYGFAAISFGFTMVVLHLVLGYFEFAERMPVSTLVMGALFCALGTVFSFFDKPVPIMLQDSLIFDYVFFEFFCIQRVHRKDSEASMPYGAAFFMGIFFAVLSCFVPPMLLVVGLLALLFTTITLGSPEFAYILALLVLPCIGLHPYIIYVFATLLALSGISFIRKAAQGKRVLFFEQYDLAILLMMLLIFLSGIFMQGYESFKASLWLCLFSIGYFLTSSIITNRRLADRAMNAVVVSSLPVSAIAITSYIIDSVKLGKFSHPDEGSLFGSGASLAAFLIVCFYFSLAHTGQTHALYKKLPYSIMVVISFIALLTTGELFAIFALLMGFAFFFAFKLKNKTAAAITVAALFLVPLTVYILPRGVLEKIYEFIPSVQSYEAMTSTLLASIGEMFKNPFLGIGIGQNSFSTAMQGSGAVGFNSGNLFIELALEAGLLTLLIFLFLIVARIRHRIFYSPYIKASVLKRSQPLVSAAVCSLLFYGFFSYLFSNLSIFYLFFVVFGIESAMLRVSRRASDERILYYEAARSNESSAIDVTLNENF